MIKTDAPIMQSWYADAEVEISPERRAFLARKGQRLYGKYCDTKGRGICAESFAEYHVWRGELAVVRDFLDFLDTQLDMLRDTSDPAAMEQQRITEQLLQRIRAMVTEGEPQ